MPGNRRCCGRNQDLAGQVLNAERNCTSLPCAHFHFGKAIICFISVAYGLQLSTGLAARGKLLRLLFDYFVWLKTSNSHTSQASPSWPSIWTMKDVEMRRAAIISKRRTPSKKQAWSARQFIAAATRFDPIAETVKVRFESSRSCITAAVTFETSFFFIYIEFLLERCFDWPYISAGSY